MTHKKQIDFSVKQTEPHLKVSDNDKASRNLKSIIPKDSERGFPLLHVDDVYFNFSDLIVTDETKKKLKNIVAENKATKKLHAYGLKPRNKVLFCGPPGTGKTLSARIVSSSIGYPFVYVMFDAILSSYLGETAINLRRIFDFVKTNNVVVLFDEFDMVGKKRDDPHEHGEIKRVVNNFIQMLDDLETQSIVIAATNHQYLLDKAVWRRFDDIVYFDLPDDEKRAQLFEKYLRVLERDKNIVFEQLAKQTSGHSAADIAQICEEALRRSIIDDHKVITEDHIVCAILEQKRRMKIILGEANG